MVRNEDGSGHTMGFQSMLEEPDRSDIELGLDSYCVSAERGAPVYGGVREVRLQDTVIRVVLDPEVAADFGLDDPVIEVILAVDVQSIERLRVGLRQILNYGRESSRPAVEL